jgi:rhodanese-related sulfurtransferase
LFVSCGNQPEPKEKKSKEVPERIEKNGIYELNSAYLDSINVSDVYTVFDIRFEKDEVDVEYYPNSIVIFPEHEDAFKEVFSYESDLDVLVIGRSAQQSKEFAMALKSHFKSVSYYYPK